MPHPPGYPLEITPLQGWLWLARAHRLGGDLNWQAAPFSAACAALSAGVTLHTACDSSAGAQASSPAPRVRQAGTPALQYMLLWATLAAVAWAISPLLWTQAVIAEVYALHAVLLALLGWAVLVHPTRLWVLRYWLRWASPII